MNLLRSYSLLSLMGIASCLSSELVAMEPIKPEPKNCLSQPLDTKITILPFSYMRALKMEYKDFNEEAYNTCYAKGIKEKLDKNFSAAIEAFLEAASYRKIPALKFLAQCYKQSGQYVEAFKWMMWAGQESFLQGIKFEWPSEFCDEIFRDRIYKYGEKGIIEDKEVKTFHYIALMIWSDTIKCSGKPRADFLTQQILSNSYDTYPSQLEPYLTKKECLAKKYLFKTGKQLEPVLEKIDTGEIASNNEISRIIAAIIARPTPKNIELCGRIYEKIKDYSNAEFYYLKATSLGSDSTLLCLGILYKTQKRYQEAYDLIYNAVLNGLTCAQAELGYYYLKGIGTKINLKEAFSWFSKAAEQDDVLGFYNLGSCYLYGWGVDKDYSKAKENFEKAAALGDPTALNDLAIIYSAGLGIPSNKILAESYFKKAMEGGEPLAFDGYAGELYLKKNIQAFHYAKKAVELKVVGSQFILGLCYAEGLGVKHNKKLGFDLVKQGIDESLICVDTPRGLTSRIFYTIRKHFNLMVQKKHVYTDDVVNNEIYQLIELVKPIYSEENGTLNLYYQAYLNYFDGNLQNAHDLFCEAYASGIDECKDMIKLIATYLREQELEETYLSSSESCSLESNDHISEEIGGISSSEYSHSEDEISIFPIETQSNADISKKTFSVKKERSHPKNIHEQKIIEAREKKELKQQQYDLKARQKLQLKVAEICGDGSLNIEVGAPKELEFIFDDSAAGKAVSEKFYELLTEENSKLADILNDIKFGYKTNNVHPLSGPLKGYFARNISHSDRLVYRWVGPGQLEIRSCETHYGQ